VFEIFLDSLRVVHNGSACRVRASDGLMRKRLSELLGWTENYGLSGAGNPGLYARLAGRHPWDKQSAQLYRTGSRIFYAGDITPPTLILSGTNDTTAPITEYFALRHALSSQRVPVGSSASRAPIIYRGTNASGVLLPRRR
jgi:hypothetical protein